LAGVVLRRVLIRSLASPITKMPRSRNWLVSLIMLGLACALAACVWSPVEPYVGQAQRVQTLYVVASGWHTEIGLSADDLSGPIEVLRHGSPSARYFVFGWGERGYYMQPNVGLGDLLAASMPASSVMLVIPMRTRLAEFFASGSRVFEIPVAQEGIDRLTQFLWGYLEKDPHQLPRLIGNGPYPESGFYASLGTYSLANTCNTWTAQALQVAGLPVSVAGVVFAHEVVSQIRPLATPE